MQSKPIGKRSILLFLVLVLIQSFGTAQNADTPYRMKTVVIDAGHGGNDPGNLGTGRYKTREKDIALEVALMVGGYIEKQFPEIKVIYTRSTDVFIGLSDRTDIANKAKADLFISIHCNAASNPSAMGVETFALGLHKNKENLEVAMKENSAIFLEDDYKTKYEGFDPNSPESIIALTIMQSAYLQQSLSISSYIQNQFKERVGRKDRGVKQAGFLVLRKTTMPSILIELGFLTNPVEEDFLNSENGKTYMASAIFRGFKEYKELVEDPLPSGGAANSTPAAETERKSEEEKKQLAEKEKQESERKALDQAKLKATADSLEQAKQQRIEEKKKREAELAQKAKEDEQQRLKAEADSLENLRLAKIAAFEAKQKQLEQEKAKELAEKKAQEDADKLAKKQQAENELAAKEEAKKWLEEIKEVKEKELEEAKKKTETDIEKERLEAEKREKQEQLAAAKRLAEEKRTKAAADSLAAQRLISEQNRIDSLARERSDADKRKQDSLNLVQIAQENERKKAKYEEELAEAKRLANLKATQDSIAEVRRKEAEELAVSINDQKAATAEEAELLFLQLRKKQLEQRIAQLKGNDVEVITMEDIEERTKKTAVVENPPLNRKPEGVRLMVQVATSAKPLAKSDPQFKGQEVWQYQQDGLYKYTVGNTQDFEEITKLQSDLRNLGFQGAFVVAFKDGDRIKVSEARELLKK